MAMSLPRAYGQRQQEAPASCRLAHQRLRQDATNTTVAGNTAADDKPNGTRSRFHRLTPEEIAEKHQNGQCYFCLKKYTKEHKCSAKGVFLLELAYEEDDLGDTKPDLGISLHA